MTFSDLFRDRLLTSPVAKLGRAVKLLDGASRQIILMLRRCHEVIFCIFP
jgi:hypothetical protein